MALTASGVGYTYTIGHAYSQRALLGVSFSLAPGELLLVLGATGSGKSTLLRLASGLLTPDAGALEIDGAPLDAESARGKVGLVFQDPESQLFAETVLADVMFAPRNLGKAAGDAERIAEKALAAVGLDPAEFGGRSPFSLSGGEARRAAIAGVLAMDPRYLLLDEPTAGLDARGRAAVRGVVREARRDTGVMVVSHSAEEFLGEATGVLVLAEGAPVFLGGPAQLLADPSPLSSAGLDAPAVVKAQLLARERGAEVPEPFTLDAAEAARRLAAAGGWA
ncbi:MAG: ATP-binding cassette domain-containing protein [Coriobacteriia bacterium]